MQTTIQNLLLILGLLPTLAFQGDMANDCVFYFPTQPGHTFEITNYDVKGKVTGLARHAILSKSEAGGATVLDASVEVFENEDGQKLMAKGDYKVKCENDAFYFEFGGLSSTLNQQQQSMKDMQMKMKADYLDIPNNPSPGQSLKDGQMTVEFLMENGEKMPMMGEITVNVSERKVEGMEKITTPAGTFDCVKISYNVRAKIAIMNVESRAIEWFCKGVGMVRSETYNKKAK
ncbi:MAG: DUF3108 domain-containing protein [Microscillaceae bacterium]|nr:DUF3108 domain-containing protein [Microscillaceae bacterium]